MQRIIQEHIKKALGRRNLIWSLEHGGKIIVRACEDDTSEELDIEVFGRSYKLVTS